MNHLFTTFILICFTISVNAQDTIALSDFEILNNTSWKGSLTYKDYSSGKQETIPSKLQIKIEDNKIKWSIQYDYEPHKNNKSSVKIKKNGTYYGNEKVVSNIIENGVRTIITTYKGRDNGNKATFFNIHKFDNYNYSLTKEVRLENTAERFVRSTYSLKKNN